MNVHPNIGMHDVTMIHYIVYTSRDTGCDTVTMIQ